jgi:cephalosporin hydroxylase
MLSMRKTRSALELVKTSFTVLRERGPAYFTRAVLNQVVPAQRFRRLAKGVKGRWPDATVEDVLAFLSDPLNCNLVTAMQLSEEFSGLLRLYQELRPRNVLEIGTAKGGTLFAFATLAGPGARLISLDLPTRRFGGGGYLLDRRWAMYAEFAYPSQQLHLIRADSHAPSSLQQVRELLAGDSLDFLFIDGDHRYEGVKADYEMFGPLVRPGGLIAFHDIVGHTPALIGGVPRFWAEVKAGQDASELVRSPTQDGFGIGILRKQCSHSAVLAPPPNPCAS